MIKERRSYGFKIPEKRYINTKVIAKATCKDGSKAKFLHEGFKYSIIKQKKNLFLIKFKSGAAKWYKKEYFYDPQMIIN